MNDITRLATSARSSRAVAYGGLVFVGGQTADDRTLDIKGQTSQVLSKIDRFLSEAGTDKSRLLSVQVWVRDIAADFSGMNEVWDAWVDPDASPARATAQCSLASPTILVEMVAIAATAKS